jgi:hypothetical protein
VQTGVRPQNSLEIDSDPRKSDVVTPIKRRTEIWIGKREFGEIGMGIVCHKQKRRTNRRAHRAKAERFGFKPKNSTTQEFQDCVEPQLIEVMKMKMHAIQSASIGNLIQMTFM